MLSFGSLCVLLGLGYWLRRRLRFLQRLYLPASVIAGLVGLAIIQILERYDPVVLGWRMALPPEATAGWSKLPGLLINIVFASLFLGRSLPPVARVWKSAGRQLAYGQIVAWGQYAVGCALVLLLIKPLFGLPDIFAGIMPVGFEGGHGTAAGMKDVFDGLGYPEMKDFALASATGGILGAIIVGMGLVNWAMRKGYVVKKAMPALDIEEMGGILPRAQRPPAGRLTVSSDVIESFSLHLVFVGMAILLGWLMKAGLLLAVDPPAPGEKASSGYTIMSSFPLFPLCMLGGVIIQWLADRFDPHEHMDEGLMLRIQNCALDFLVVAAIATIRLDVVAKGWLPLLILIAAGIGWNVLCLTVLARRIFRDAWFERAIAEMGQSMGVTATGLLLLRVVDPDYETEAAEAFAAKQLLHEPFMGGGLWTGAAIPLLAVWGGWPVFGIAMGAMAIWAACLLGMNRQNRP
jgi:ESS family glutamate:Na+ symporter